MMFNNFEDGDGAVQTPSTDEDAGGETVATEETPSV